MGLFIRQTQTRNTATGERYFTFRRVRGERIGGKVRQVTVLNLGRNFSVAQAHWPLLCQRIEEWLQPQQSLAPMVCPEALERVAQRCFEPLVSRSAVSEPSSAPVHQAVLSEPATDFQEVDVASLTVSQPRSVGGAAGFGGGGGVGLGGEAHGVGYTGHPHNLALSHVGLYAKWP